MNIESSQSKKEHIKKSNYQKMKKKVAIVCGGDQSEYEVSLRSAEGLKSFIPAEKYDVTTVVLRGRDWHAVTEEGNRSIDKEDFSYTNKAGEKCTFDCCYMTIHGIPGEDGRLQGYFEMIGMPYTCCGVLAASLTYSKFTCNHYLHDFGISIAKDILLRNGESICTEEVVEKLSLPVFVKPNVGGSSYGVTKVKKAEDLQEAIEKAFGEGNEVIIERFMSGTEITCGIYKTGKGEDRKTNVFPITEVVSENEFFDYDAKYKGKVSEITPARLQEDMVKKVKSLTSKIYDLIGAKGIIRVDYIISEDGTVNLLEVNTTPGMTATSFIPQQIRAAGMEIGDVMEEIIENA